MRQSPTYGIEKSGRGTRKMGESTTITDELCHTNKITFTMYDSEFGLTPELMQEVRDLREKLTKAKYGRFI